MNPIVPRIVIQSIAGGVLLMACFTMMWTGIAHHGLQGKDHGVVTAVFMAIAAAFIACAFSLFAASGRLPRLDGEDQRREGKRLGQWYGIVFGTEGFLIAATSTILVLSSQGRLIIPSMALIVGLHFYPMARLFKRTIDYYLATWTCLVAIIGIRATLTNALSPSAVFSLVGIGVALATTTYGVYMVSVGYQMLRPLRERSDSGPETNGRH